MTKPSTSQGAMREIAKALQRFKTSDFVKRVGVKLPNVSPKHARSYVAEMSRLGLIVEDGKAPQGRGAVPNYWRWVGEGFTPEPVSYYTPPERYASVWDYAQGIRQ